MFDSNGRNFYTDQWQDKIPYLQSKPTAVLIPINMKSVAQRVCRLSRPRRVEGGRVASLMRVSLCCLAFAACTAQAYCAVVHPIGEGTVDPVDAFSSASVIESTMIASPAALGQPSEKAAEGYFPVVMIGVPDTADIGLQRPMMISTIEKLSRAMPSTRFRLRVILTADGAVQLNTLKPDFMFAPAGTDGILQREGIESYRIATRKSDMAKEAGKSMGSVFVTHKSRTELAELKDLRNKTVVAGLPDSVPGWLAALGEVKKAGFDPDDFFGSSEFLFEYYPEIIAALWGGGADAAVLPTCLLEALKRQGLVAVDELKVLHDKSDESLACKRSTDLYPDFSLIGFS